MTAKVEAGELRQDFITHKWVAIATARGKRPHDFHPLKKPKKLARFKKTCPFCALDVFPQEPDVLRLPNDEHAWQVHIFPNKYPAFSPKDEFKSWNVGPYRAVESVGYHEIMATRWHNETDAHLTQAHLILQLEALQMRYRQLQAKPSVSYIQIIKNYGEAAGASIEHPHHQIFTTPILPNDLHDQLVGSERYAKAHGRSVYEDVLEFERKTGDRIIFENEYFTAYCPYASWSPFEVWIMPRQAHPFFENTTPQERQALAEAMQQVFGRLYVGLDDPPYNYYIHSAPCDDTGFVCDKEQFKHFRWHLEIVPRFEPLAGFEFGTGIIINASVPEECAAFLRDQKLQLA